jgi:hypothetical protein
MKYNSYLLPRKQDLVINITEIGLATCTWQAPIGKQTLHLGSFHKLNLHMLSIITLRGEGVWGMMLNF